MNAAELPENVDHITIGDREIFLVGTAHVSRQSTELVDSVIRTVQPDAVAVELCEARYLSLKDPDRWKNTDVISVIRQGRAYVLVAQLMLAAFQKKLGDQLDIAPGAEMMRASAVAEELGVPLTLADRDIKTTLKRTWNSLGIITMGKVVFSLIFGVLGNEKIDEKEVEKLKQADALDALMREFSEHYPNVRTALIDERDQYLAHKIAHAPGKRIVAIMGAGHVPGIKQWLGKEIDLSALEVVPKRRRWLRYIGWIIPIAIIALIVYGFFGLGSETGSAMLRSWIIINSVLAGLGAMLAMAHPVTILVAAIVSPFTSINPLIAAGTVAALVEAGLRRPRVADFETIAIDLATLPGIWRNRLSRILLVFMLVNLCGAIGTIWGGSLIASMV